MEILALIGMPKVVTGSGGLSRLTRSSIVLQSDGGSLVTNTTPQPGETIDHTLSAYQSGNISGGFRLTLPTGMLSTVTGKFDRIVIGFRAVFTSTPDLTVYANVPLLEFMSQITTNQGVSTVGSTSRGFPIPFNSGLTLPEGQYLEFVIDPATTKTEVYIDGIKVASHALYGYPIVSVTYISFSSTRKGNARISGHLRDLYIGRVEKGEVFESVGSLRVQEFPVTSTTSTVVTPDDINTLTTKMTSSQGISDTVGGVNEIVQGYGDPTVLKTALAITAISPGVSSTGEVAVKSGAVEFTSDSGVISSGGTYPPVAISIDPAKIGSDFKLTFRIKPPAQGGV